jgi:4'-phosphopantetheinyl transferase
MADGAPPLASWPSPRIGADEVHVWRVPLDDDRGASADRHDATVRAAQLRAQARAGLLRILAHYAGMPADALRLEVDALGKPCLRHAGAPSFNLSHTRGLALVAVSAGTAVGIDVEQLRPLADADALARRFLSPAEAGTVLEAAPAERNVAFLRTWTRKEAVLKASGHGLDIDTRLVEVGSGPDDRVGTIGPAAGAARFHVLSLHLPPPWIGALAVAGAHDTDGLAVRCFDLPADAGPAPDRSLP